MNYDYVETNRCLAKLSRESLATGILLVVSGGNVSTCHTKIDDGITWVITAKNRGAETPMTFVFVVNVGKARVFLTAVSHVAHAISHTRIATCQRMRRKERDRNAYT